MESVHVEQKMKNYLRMVAQQNASDLHLVVGRHPTIRIDGKLFPLAQEPVLMADDTKALSDIILNEENKNILMKKGEVDFSYSFEEKARFRVNIFFQRGNVSVAMRFITSRIRSLEELNLPNTLYDLTKYSKGLVLVTGPIGQGKSTTLAALIDYINHNEDKHIITIEDPIEYVYEQDRCIVNQREVGQDTKSFNDALRAVFREDANVVLIGELRDLNTIATAMTAAETGHLIFATLHTNDSAQTIDRIVDIFPAHQQNQIRTQLASVLIGVVSQRLIPKIGGDRVPVLEIMFKNRAIENLIRENKSYQIDNVIETSIKEGMVSMDRSLADLVKRGIITAEDALRYAKNRDHFRILNGNSHYNIED